MQPKLPLALYRFRFQAIDPVSLPGMADPLWSSVFGLALRRLSCIAPGTECEKCSLHARCNSFLLTRGAIAPDNSRTGLAGKINTRPPPLIFQGPVRDFTLRVPPNATFSTSLVLAGSGNTRLPAVIRAMSLAGELGIGRNRSRFRLLRVTCVGPGALAQQITPDSGSLPSPEPVCPPEIPGFVQIELLTPWLLPNTKNNHHPDSPETLVYAFLGKIIRRVSLMQQCHTGQPLEIDFKSLTRKTGKVRLAAVDLTGSADYRHGKGRFLAVRGSFTLDMTGMETTWPFLWMGQWLNIPKLAAKGFGRYRLTGLPENLKEM